MKLNLPHVKYDVRLVVLAFACLLHLLSPASSVSALDAVKFYRQQNDVLYYGEGSCTSGSTSTSPGSANSGGCGNDAANDPGNMKQIFDYLKGQFQSKGFSPDDAANAAAGMMGNWQQESGMNSYIHGGSGCGNGPATGIAQWCFARVDKLQQFAASQGKPVTCLSVQLEFAWSELAGGYSSVIDHMKGKTAPEAALVFDTEFEVSGDGKTLNNVRETNAGKIIAQMTGQAPPSASSTANPTGNATSSTSTNCGAVADNGECKDPFRGLQNSGPLRWDGGEDYGGENGSGPVYAACPGEIVHVYATQRQSGWPGIPGSYITYKVTSGKAKDLFIYIAEDCTPKVVVGDKVDTNTVICDYKQADAYLETGWSEGGQNSYISWSDYRGAPNCFGSNSGQDFGKFLTSIGGQDGHPDPSCGQNMSHNPPPASWPKWN